MPPRAKPRKKQTRKDKAAEAIYNLMNVEEFPEHQPWEEAEDDDRLTAEYLADNAIKLVDALWPA